MKAKINIVAVLAVLGLLALWVAVGNWVTAEVVYPVENGANVFVRHVWHPLKEALIRPRLVSEKKRLEKELAQVRLQVRDILALEVENSRLRKMLDYRPRLKGDWIAAPVLSHGGTLGARDFLRVGKGSLAGVRVGAAVVAPQGLVGRVQTVSPHTAEVRLITDSTLAVACEVETGNPSTGVVFAILYGNRLAHIRREAVLPPHARIVTSGLGEVYPRGLAIGRLAYGTHEDETQLEQEGEVLPALDFADLEDVFIRREN